MCDDKSFDELFDQIVVWARENRGWRGFSDLCSGVISVSGGNPRMVKLYLHETERGYWGLWYIIDGLLNPKLCLICSDFRKPILKDQTLEHMKIVLKDIHLIFEHGVVSPFNWKLTAGKKMPKNKWCQLQSEAKNIEYQKAINRLVGSSNTCCVCFEDISWDQITPCNHGLCYSCTAKLEMKESERGSKECPKCRASFTTREGYIGCCDSE